ncbi:MAG TPA: DUF4190 domain-containing protein [Rhodanobacteraceae bacterium]|nr:DUF4190 domain-containing protein [Rhodanobacteraceae bacterium]
MNTTIRQTSVLAVFSLVFGILAWCALPFVGAIIAVVCGHSARGEIRRAPAATMDGGGMALAGLILGWLQLAACIAVIAFVFLFVGGLALFGHFH